MNVVVTEEQRALLFELARLDPSVRSASAFLRTMLDQVTPLLRQTLPLMRLAAEELDTTRHEAREQLRGSLSDFLREIDQLDLLDSAPGASAPQRSEDGRSKRRSRRG